MSSTFRSCNIVYKAIRIITVRIIVLHSYFYTYTIFHSLTINDLVIQRCFALIQICDKFFDSTFIVKCALNRFFFSIISQNDAKSLCQKCHFPKSLFQHTVIKNKFFKDFSIRFKTYFCSCFFQITFANDF